MRLLPDLQSEPRAKSISTTPTHTWSRSSASKYLGSEVLGCGMRTLCTRCHCRDAEWSVISPDLASTFTRVAEELHTQYVIGFTPEVMDGKLHALQVRVKRPGMSARTRKSYVASPDK